MSFLRKATSLLATVQRCSKTQRIGQTRHIKRWVAPTLRELKIRKEKFNTETRTPRNTFAEWNQNAEVFAFGKRLQENFNIKILHSAFVDRSFVSQEELRQQKLGIEDPQLNMEDNHKLIEMGETLISDYVQAFLNHSLPNCPTKGIRCIFDWLTAETQLAHISKNIGTHDLILCAGNAPDNKILRDTFVAVVGALFESSGEETAYTFIRDFICTHLNQKDLTEIWEIEEPFKELQQLCKDKNYGDPEPRLIGNAGINTVLAVYHVAIYSNQKMIGKGFGESISIAIETSALNALRKFYGIQENMKPFNFDMQLDSRTNQKSKQKTLS